jgi:hypothetical protein
MMSHMQLLDKVENRVESSKLDAILQGYVD